METTEEDDDLKLFKASATLLADLEDALPKVLWKPAKSGNARKVHTQAKSRDLDHAVRLIEAFQSEPQLLDARLKHILPPIVTAYLAYIQLPPSDRKTENLDLETAICSLLYTLCKVRGYKVILGFLSNEPRYLEPILLRLERTYAADQEQKPQWQVPYVLLLWMSHLLLTPFDLASISDQTRHLSQLDSEEWPQGLSSVAARILATGLNYLPTSTKAQDAAAMLLVRLVRRPDMQKLGLDGSLATRALRSLQDEPSNASTTIYERLGPFRVLSGVAASPELGRSIPQIYVACQSLLEQTDSPIITNAVAKKLAIKIFRDIAVLFIRAKDLSGQLLDFFETTSALEDVIDHLLRSLGDRDTPVRFAAAKAISLIVLELDAEMRQEVIQAVLDTFKEDMPRSTGQALDFRTADALRWHGLTLCLGHTLFKRSASPSQLPDIVAALVSALQFEQRTATGSTNGTNVRDAANFGIWSLSRRYKTEELLAVQSTALAAGSNVSVIQHLAIELVLSACLDPAGNVRRGSSAALQELVGRHPNQVKEGIALVQTVDYQAVGLRRRAMVDVAVRATELDAVYFRPVLRALVGWRGLGSPDVSSREAAATSLASLTEQGYDQAAEVVREVLHFARTVHMAERELLHGLVLTIALILEKACDLEYGPRLLDPKSEATSSDLATLLNNLGASNDDFTSRTLRSELPSAVAKMLAAYCSFQAKQSSDHNSRTDQNRFPNVAFEIFEKLTEQLLTRGEETIREAIPSLSRSLLALKRLAGKALGCLGSQTLVKQIAIDGVKSTLNGAGRAMALGALAPVYGNGLQRGKVAEMVSTLGSLTRAMSVDWRIIGIRALQLAVEGAGHGDEIELVILEHVVHAVHQGLNDYTIDERGDVGSLVRLQAIACTSSIFATCESSRYTLNSDPLRTLQADILRLSFEKLDRVRLAAAQCQHRHLIREGRVLDIASVSSHDYFEAQFQPLDFPIEGDWKYAAILEGAMSAAGISSEQLLQASRSAMANTLSRTSIERPSHLMTIYTAILKTSLASPTSPLTTPALTLLAFLLDVRIPQNLASTSESSGSAPFKWLNLLSAVQKSHHKSNDIPRIAAAVGVYRGLAEVGVIREEVLKKLLGMLRTNPYPRVRMTVAETLFMVLGEEDGEARGTLNAGDWMGDRKANEGLVKDLEQRLLSKT